MKRRISLLLALVIVLGSFGTAFAAVPNTAKEKAEFLAENEILKGNNSGDLMLDKKETRQNMVIMLSRLMKQETEARDHKGNEAARFEDITDEFYRPFVAWSVANNYIIGTSETTFNPKGNVKAIDYSLVLLRALGHLSGSNAEAEYTVSFQMAKDLGLLEGLDVEAKDELTREQMSVMIYNALGTNMKGSEKTLAEFLGIKMPVEEVTELKVKVRTENLKEVIVELNKDLEGTDLLEADNYRIKNHKVESVRRDGKNIILVLENAMDSKDMGKKHDLVIRNLSRNNKELIGTYEFVVRDNVAPEVLKAEFLGKKGIKVTFSEPIAEAKERNFRLVDDKNVVMEVNNYGREIVLVPYGKEEFDMDKYTELKVLEVTDYAGIKSNSKTLEIAKADKNYKDAPKVVSVKAFENKLRVRFDKEIYEPSVLGGEKGNVEYRVRGLHSAYPVKSAKMLDAYTAEYTFNRTLSDRHTEVVISGVKNHDDVVMEKTTEEIEVIYDRSEPVVIKTDRIVKEVANKKANVAIELTFDKDIKSEFFGQTTDKATEIAKHVQLFQTNLKDLSKQVDVTKKITKISINKNIVRVEIEDLAIDNKYILETDKFVDTSILANRMYREYTLIELGKADAKMAIKDVILVRSNKTDNRVEEIRIIFDRKLDRISAENAKNYILTDKFDRETYLADIEDAKIELDNNGFQVNLIFGEPLIVENYKTLEVTRGVEGLDGTILGSRFIHNLDEISAPLKARIEKALEGIENLSLTPEEKIAKAYLEQDNNLIPANHRDIEKQLKVLEARIAEEQKEEDKVIKTAREALEESIEKAKEQLKKTPEGDAKKALEKEIILATAVAGNKDATKKALETAKTELDEAVTGAETEGAKAEAQKFVNENSTVLGYENKKSNLKEDEIKLVEAARKAFDALSSEAKAKLANNEVEKLLKDLEATIEMEKLVNEGKAFKLGDVDALTTLTFTVAGVKGGEGNEIKLTKAQLAKPFVVEGIETDAVKELVTAMIKAGKIAEKDKDAAIAKIKAMEFNTAALKEETIESGKFLVLDGSLVSREDVKFFAPVSSEEGYKVTIWNGEKKLVKISNFEDADSKFLEVNAGK